MADLAFACTCGALRGHLSGATARNGTRAECFCADCRAGELYARQPDPAPGPVQLYQTLPFRIRFTQGAEHLAAFSFSPRGPLRWQATCCGAPIALTMRSPRLSFASVRTDRLEDPAALGPVTARAFVEKPNGKRGHEGLMRFVTGFATRALGARLTGKWRDTPFFDGDGTPSGAVTLVSKADRAALTA